jgi:hypothetical protein
MEVGVNKMRLFCMDLHISVIADFKTACPEVEVVDWCLSGHAWVMKRKQEHPDHINPFTWRNLDEEMIRKFQDRYDSFLRGFDGFIVGFASSFAMIYEKYNKPILMLNAVRYDIPFCWTKDTQMRLKWHECLERLNSRGLLTIVSNNKADQVYTKLGCGLDSRYIPSLCLYTNTFYTPTKSTFLCYNGSFSNHPLITPKSALPYHHEWSDVASFRGIINFPYEVSLMSVFEQFTAGCPLFFPSKSFWKSNPNIQSLSAYWGADLPSNFNAISSPADWIELADMYGVFQSPNTYYFDSEEHLFRLLETFEYRDDREFRKTHIENVKKEWKGVLHDIISKSFWAKHPRHMAYNRLPLLANVVFDGDYTNCDVKPQHSFPPYQCKLPLTNGDTVFVKTDYLKWFIANVRIDAQITLVTGVSDLSPTDEQVEFITNHPSILKWIGCNIIHKHPKIIKMPIGVGEPERINGNHEVIAFLHASRIPWESKKDEVCVPYHSETHSTRILERTLPSLPFEEYMAAIGQHKFVVCQRGNGLDTHRVCEVLLMGSVPVLEHSGLDDMYSKWPCLTVDSFNSINTAGFVFDESKYQSFIDTFWISDSLKDQLL